MAITRHRTGHAAIREARSLGPGGGREQRIHGHDPVERRKVCHLFGVSYETAKNKIYAEAFPVPVRKEGRLLVVDKAVLERYFADRRAADLARLDSTDH